MSRPKLEVNEVWILEEVMPYDGSEILGVFVDPEIAMKGRDDKGRWEKVHDRRTGQFLHWSTQPASDSFGASREFYLLTSYPVRSK